MPQGSSVQYFVAELIYVRKHPTTVTLGDRITVTGKYLNWALFVLNESALHVRSQLLAHFPPEREWRKIVGNYRPSDNDDRLIHVEMEPTTSTDCESFLDLAGHVTAAVTLGDILAWGATNGRAVRQVLGGDPRTVNEYLRGLFQRKATGAIRSLRVTKVFDGV